MKTLLRNKSTFYYADKTGRVPLLDDDGNFTGDYVDSYSDPVKAKGNISPATGSVGDELFGLNLQYDKVIVMEEALFGETAHLWVDADPQAGEPYDYIVLRIAKSLNSVSCAISRVDVT